MRSRLLIIPSVLIFQFAGAQESAVLSTSPQATVATPPAAASSTPVTPPVTPAPPAESSGTADTQVAILDYKSVYEAATAEEEVKMAAERFSLTAAQQDIWLSAATDRRATEKQARENLDSSKAGQFSKHGVYMGLRSSHNTFHETIMGYLTPTQKQAFENDRLILQAKQRKLAKLPPPPPPAPVDTTARIDSSMVKEPVMEKETGKKPKKKKKARK